jgi:hypothetical protein
MPVVSGHGIRRWRAGIRLEVLVTIQVQASGDRQANSVPGAPGEFMSHDRSQDSPTGAIVRPGLSSPPTCPRPTLFRAQNFKVTVSL